MKQKLESFEDVGLIIGCKNARRAILEGMGRRRAVEILRLGRSWHELWSGGGNRSGDRILNQHSIMFQSCPGRAIKFYFGLLVGRHGVNKSSSATDRSRCAVMVW